MIPNMAEIYKKGLSIDCSKEVKEKGGLTYLSWPFAVSKLKTLLPDAHWTYYHDMDTGLPYFDGPKGAFVKLRLFLDETNEQAQDFYHPVLDNRNKPIANPDSFDVNSALMRGLVKVIAITTGIGLYIYAGEDLPSDMVEEEPEVVMARIMAFDTLLCHPANEDVAEKVRGNHERGGWNAAKMRTDEQRLRDRIAKWDEANGVKTIAVQEPQESPVA